MKTVLIRCSILCFLNVFFACEVYYDVATSTDNDINFSNYKSFAWLPDNTDTINRPYNNEILRNNIRNFFGKCFFERGFIFDADSPDVLLQLTIVNQKRNKETVFYQNPWPYYYNRYYYHSIYFHPYHFDYYYRSYPVYYFTPNYYIQNLNYIEGSITLNVYDRKIKKLIWLGSTDVDIYNYKNVNRDIHPAIEAIIEKFPVEPLSQYQK